MFQFLEFIGQEFIQDVDVGENLLSVCMGVREKFMVEILSRRKCFWKMFGQPIFQTVQMINIKIVATADLCDS